MGRDGWPATLCLKISLGFLPREFWFLPKDFCPGSKRGFSPLPLQKKGEDMIVSAPFILVDDIRMRRIRISNDIIENYNLIRREVLCYKCKEYDLCKANPSGLVISYEFCEFGNLAWHFRGVAMWIETELENTEF